MVAPLPFLISNPFPSGITEASGNALGKQTALGQAVTFFNQNPKVARQSRWSIGIQRELWGGWVFEASYVGDIGSNIEINRNLNAVPNSLLSTDTSLTVAMNTNNTNLGASVKNPYLHLRHRHRHHLHRFVYRRRTYHFAPSIAASLPGLRHRHHHQQRWQDLVSLRPVQLEQEVHQGLGSASGLYLVEVDAGD